MARNTQVRARERQSLSRQSNDASYTADPYSSSAELDINGESYYRKNKMRVPNMSTKQIVLFWSGTSALILIAFYLGFIAGKREGAISVLNQAGEQMVRLELKTPIAPTALKGGEGVSETDLLAKTEKLDQETDEPLSEIDFTSSASIIDSEKIKGAEILDNKKVLATKPKFEEVYRGQGIFSPPKDGSIVKKQEPLVKIDPQPQKIEKKVPPPVVPLESLAPKPGWYVQIAAATSDQDARTYYQKIVDKNLNGSLEPATIRNRDFFRVLVGPFANQREAVGKRTELKQAIGVSGEPFIRQVR